MAAPPEPDDTAPPVISGTARYGETLSTSNGGWIATPTPTYSYQWQHCNNDGCTDIAGATGQTYTLVVADIGHRMGVTVTATNTYGSGTASADYSDEVAGIPPTGPKPTIAGIARVGQTLTASVAPWTGEGPLTYAWSWGRSQGESGDQIEGAHSNTYTVTAADVGMMLTAVVEVTGPLGSDFANQSIGPVVPAPAAGGAASTNASGNVITVSGSGFGPNTDVTVVLRSDPVTLGVAHTDATGSFTATFALPAGVSAGVHTLVFTGVDAAGNPITVEQTVTIAATTGTLPVTGDHSLPLALLAAGLILAGTMSLRAGRRLAPPMI